MQINCWNCLVVLFIQQTVKSLGYHSLSFSLPPCISLYVSPAPFLSLSLKLIKMNMMELQNPVVCPAKFRVDIYITSAR